MYTTSSLTDRFLRLNDDLIINLGQIAGIDSGGVKTAFVYLKSGDVMTVEMPANKLVNEIWTALNSTGDKNKEIKEGGSFEVTIIKDGVSTIAATGPANDLSFGPISDKEKEMVIRILSIDLDSLFQRQARELESSRNEE